MAIVRKVWENCNGEVMDVEAFKGSTREMVKRHVSSVIPFFLDCGDSVPVNKLERCLQIIN